MNGLSKIFRKLSLPIKTGQLTSYGSGTGLDDGALRPGETPVFVVLSTGQYSGTTNITINSKTDAHSNNVVYCVNNHRMYSRYVSASVGPTSNGLLPWTTNGSGEGVFTYAAAARAANLAGHNDWRPANARELFDIMDLEAPTGVPDSTAFPTFPASTAFSITTAPNNTAKGLVGNYNGGQVASVGKTTTAYCLLVRVP